jgi:hypothetical protein
MGASQVMATVTVKTTAPSRGLLLPFGNDAPRTMDDRVTPLVLGLLSIAMLLSLFAWRNQRLREVPALTFALLLPAGLAMTSCGRGSSRGGGGGNPGTPAGSSTITLTATAASSSTTFTHSTKLTLVVHSACLI